MTDTQLTPLQRLRRQRDQAADNVLHTSLAAVAARKDAGPDPDQNAQKIIRKTEEKFTKALEHFSVDFCWFDCQLGAELAVLSAPGDSVALVLRWPRQGDTAEVLAVADATQVGEVSG